MWTAVLFVFLRRPIAPATQFLSGRVLVFWVRATMNQTEHLTRNYDSVFHHLSANPGLKYRGAKKILEKGQDRTRDRGIDR
ncbi:hypothetical protein DER45DRAFT_304083 [Fusarium avenaceum]|nr:hypothetical protein DER45DRAFT_304083 [Fusarium avenaceum]